MLASGTPEARIASRRGRMSSPATLPTFSPATPTSRAALERAFRVDSAGVRDDADPPVAEVGEDLPDQIHEVGRVAGLGAAPPQLLHDRHRDLGQVVERQVVEGPFAHETDGRVHRVAPEPLAVADPDQVARHRPGIIAEGRGPADGSRSARESP